MTFWRWLVLVVLAALVLFLFPTGSIRRLQAEGGGSGN
jgi:hypothetical protein